MIRNIKQAIKRNTRLYFSLLDLYYWINPLRLSPLQKQIEKFAQKKNDFYFIQVGAHDGISNDQIRRFIKKYRWKGVLIEPVPDHFDKLVVGYAKNQGLHFLNKAIADSAREMVFYSVNPRGILPVWTNQFSSFDKAIVLKHKREFPMIEEFIEAMNVTTITLNQVIEEYSMQELDLLVIDAEGYDYKVLRTLDLNKILPKMILIEIAHLVDDDKNRLISDLQQNSYEFQVYQGDLLACQKFDL